MPNAENLKGKGLDSRTTKEQRKIASEGGKASVRERRKKKFLREAAQILMDMDIQSGKTKRTLANLGIPESDMNYSMAIMAAMMNEATKGNVKAAAFIRDTMGDSASHELQAARLALEKKRLELEKQKLESQIKEDSNGLEQILKNMNTLAERIKAPVQDRNIEDYE